MMINSGKFCRVRGALLLAAVAVIIAGLALRRYGYAFGLSFPVVKYGGSILWGAMVYLLLAALLLPRGRPRFTLSMACGLAIAVELIRLVHFPMLDAFRSTTAGALLLGRVFSLWNIFCYLIGIGAAALFTTGLSKR